MYTVSSAKNQNLRIKQNKEKKMKKLIAIFVLVLAIMSTFAITACDKGGETSTSMSYVTRSSKTSKTSDTEQSTVTSSNSTEVPVEPTPSNSQENNSVEQPSTSQQPTTSTNQTPSEVTAVIEAITSIGSVTRDNYTTKAGYITNAEGLYAALSEDNKNLVTNYQALQTARSEYDKYVTEKETATTKITQFNAAVNDLGAYEFTQAYKDKLDAASALYNEIPEAYRAEAATSKATLDALLETYAQDKPQEVKDLIAAIEAIGEINLDNYLTKESEVSACETTYAAMDPAYQAIVTNYTTLTAARETISTLKSDVEKINAFTTAVGAITYAYTPDVKQAIDAAYVLYNQIPAAHQTSVATEKATLDGYLAQYEADLAAEIEAANQAKVTAFKEAVNAIVYEFTPECKLAIDNAYALHAEIPPTHQDQASTEKATLDGYLAQYEEDTFNALPEGVKSVILSINAIGEITVANYEEKDTEVAGIETAYGALTPENQALISNYATLQAARSTIETIKAEQAAILANINDFKTKVGAITVENTTACLTAINQAYTAYNLIPADRQSEVATEKATLDGYKAQYDALVKAAADQAAVNSFMADYNSALALGTVTVDNRDTFQAVITKYKALTTDQLALLDASVATQISTWQTAVDALKPLEPTTTTMSFEGSAAGFTSSVAMSFISSKHGNGWATTSKYRNTTITFTSDASYNSITKLDVYVYSSGGSGVQFNLYIGSTLAGTYKTSSSGWSDSRKISYSGAGLSGQIKIEAITSSSDRGAGIDELVFTHLA